jgi:hypothetical protein
VIISPQTNRTRKNNTHISHIQGVQPPPPPIFYKTGPEWLLAFSIMEVIMDFSIMDSQIAFTHNSYGRGEQKK